MDKGSSSSDLKASFTVSIGSCIFWSFRRNIMREDGLAGLYTTSSGSVIIWTKSMSDVCACVVRLSKTFEIYDSSAISCLYLAFLSLSTVSIHLALFSFVKSCLIRIIVNARRFKV